MQSWTSRRVSDRQILDCEHVYKDVMKHALRAYSISARGSRRNRSLQQGLGGQGEPSRTGQDAESRPWPAGRPSTPVDKSLIKVFVAAGMTGPAILTNTRLTARYVIVLLHVYEEHPAALAMTTAFRNPATASPMFWTGEMGSGLASSGCRIRTALSCVFKAWSAQAAV